MNHGGEVLRLRNLETDVNVDLATAGMHRQNRAPVSIKATPNPICNYSAVLFEQLLLMHISCSSFKQ